jgi:hypothetical protein
MPAATGTTGGAASSNTITAEQIAQTSAPTAYQVVDRLHRTWFRDLTGTGGVQVYLSTNQKLDGGREALRQIPAQEVALLEYLKSADAVARFGAEASGGAIIVTRR